MLAYANEHRKVILSISNNEVKSEELKRQLNPMHIWFLSFQRRAENLHLQRRVLVKQQHTHVDGF